MSDDGDVLSSLSPARRGFLLVLGAGLILVVVVIAAVLAVRHITGAVDPVPQNTAGPVLVVGGYGGSTTSLQPLVHRLEAAGRDTFVVPPVGGGTGDIRTQAQALGDAARTAMARTGSPSVDVVGYSAGGVVARTWVRDFGGADLARRVLSVGSPQHGTAVVQLAVDLVGTCPTACQQLAPDSDLLRALNSGDETPRGPVFVSVWSTHDEVVTPPESARLQGALDFTVQSVCPARSTAHGGLPSDPVVLAALDSVLGSGPPTAPSDATCGDVGS